MTDSQAGRGSNQERILSIRSFSTGHGEHQPDLPGFGLDGDTARRHPEA